MFKSNRFVHFSAKLMKQTRKILKFKNEFKVLIRNCHKSLFPEKRERKQKKNFDDDKTLGIIRTKAVFTGIRFM